MAEFSLRIVASDKVFYGGPSEIVIVPALDGEYGFMAHHDDMVVAMKPGELRFKKPDGTWEYAVVGGGVAQSANNRVTILVDSAERPEDIDEVRAREAMERAQEQLRQKQSIYEYRMSKASLARAVSRLKEKKRILIALLAVLGMGLSVSFLLRVDMGTDPYTCMNNGAAAKLGISFGTWQAALNIILLIIVFLCDKKQIGWGTVFNMFLVGYVSDFVTWVTDKRVANDVFTVMSVRIVIMLIALIVFVIAAALYMSAGMGVAP